MKSTSSWPSRQTSRYSGFVVRTTVVVRFEQAFEIIAATMFDSSRDVQAIRRSVSVMPAAREHAPAGAVPLERGDVVALREGREPLLVEVDHRQLVLVVQRFDDRRADLAGADDEDLHRGGYCAGRRILWLSWRRMRSLLALACVAALGTACAAGASPQQPDRADFTPRPLASGFSQPVFVTGAKGEAGRSTSSSRAAGSRCSRTGNGAARCSTSVGIVNDGVASRASSGSRSTRPIPTCGSSTSSTPRTTARRRSSSTARTGRAQRRRASSSPSPDPHGNHNGGIVAFRAQRRGSTSRWATAARAAIRRTARRTCGRSSASCSR